MLLFAPEPGESFCALATRAHQFGIVISGAIRVEGSDAQGNISVMGAFHTRNTFGERHCAARPETMPLLTSVVATEKSEILLLDVRQVLPGEASTSAVAWTLSSYGFYCAEKTSC